MSWFIKLLLGPWAVQKGKPVKHENSHEHDPSRYPTLNRPFQCKACKKHFQRSKICSINFLRSDSQAFLCMPCYDYNIIDEGLEEKFVD